MLSTKAGLWEARQRGQVRLVPDAMREQELLIPVQAAHHNEMMSPAVTE